MLFRALFIFLSVLFTQRYLFGGIQGLICIIPFLLCVFGYISGWDKKVVLVLLVISIFTSVDISVDTYATPAFIRYLIAVFAVYYLYINLSLSKYKLLVLLILWCFLLILSIGNIDLFIPAQFYKDIIYLFFFTFALSSYSNNLVIDEKLLFEFFLVFLICESFNYFVYLDSDSFYLSLDTTKALILLPFLYSLSKGKNYAFLLLIPTFLVLQLYVTRLIFVMMIVIVILHFILKRRSNIIFFPIIAICFYWFFIDIELGAANNKIIGLIHALQKSISISDLLYTLDPVRYNEGIMFFERSLFSIIFGQGLGVGIYDMNNWTSSVSIYDASYSIDELRTRVIYNFHDLYSSIGSRFGVLFLMMLMFNIFNNIQLNNRFYLYVTLILISCSFYSTAGMLLFTIFFLLNNSKINRN